jgi:CTP:molybdopterin cytidylyltransferase MocA
MLAPFRGRPLLQHVLDHLAAAGLGDPIVVLGSDAEAVEAAIDWRAAVRIVNPDPGRGLASSLQIGWDAAALDPVGNEAVLVVLGDQPLLRTDVVRALLEADLDPARPLLAPRYRASEGRNPVRIERTAAPLVAVPTGDRGLGLILDAHPELVRSIEVEGANPDVDSTEDLATLG